MDQTDISGSTPSSDKDRPGWRHTQGMPTSTRDRNSHAFFFYCSERYFQNGRWTLPFQCPEYFQALLVSTFCLCCVQLH